MAGILRIDFILDFSNALTDVKDCVSFLGPNALDDVLEGLFKHGSSRVGPPRRHFDL